MRFGTLLKKFRKRARFSQKELATILGLDSTYLSKMESGTRKPPERDVVLGIATGLDLNETEVDELLVSADYQPQTLFDLGFDTNDFSLKKHITVLRDIRRKTPLASYARAREEIADFLDLMRMKYAGEIDEGLAKNTLLADYLYSKVRRGGLKELYRAVNRPLGGAIVMYRGKLLLHQIGLSPVKGWWVIPMGYVNPDRGDRTAKDIAIRLTKRFLGDVELEVVKELTAEGEVLEDLDVSYMVKLGLFPAIVQIYEIKIKGKGEVKTKKGSGFFKLEEIPKIGGEIHPVMSQVAKYYFKNKKLAEELYKQGEESIEKVLNNKDYLEEMHGFERERIRKKL
ncbi:MAG: hypothetical protein A2119_01215 [Candidatus Colwellbacteria bacterium GWA2_46_10]|uniref:HTH cro/C1-type domain-containing protein n=1 Tax=Candidatus Colwellbacteria bacterium GWA2_46_10 TaxID=1797684 RepID=A0A1G1YYY6_9BACT|nr:MAG: Transcriptional regulator, XRE family [Microgenomates group bacterium GW2011_GWA1_Microgenomates_45_10]KKU19054.1 MAG: Transcriptional regulator, XRE family [Parcubacteria group bacterium GW2011_GWA2_46_10]OGY56986.1 MAG: hypothetical protein A2119_01215 [Candidatus Colwellbacteria bacterium GWA2_46_10]